MRHVVVLLHGYDYDPADLPGWIEDFILHSQTHVQDLILYPRIYGRYSKRWSWLFGASAIKKQVEFFKYLIEQVSDEPTKVSVIANGLGADIVVEALKEVKLHNLVLVNPSSILAIIPVHSNFNFAAVFWSSNFFHGETNPLNGEPTSTSSVRFIDKKWYNENEFTEDLDSVRISELGKEFLNVLRK